MHLLLREVRVADPNSPFADQVVDILIRDGVIEQIGKALEANGADVWSNDGAYASPGWLDIGAWVPDPGYEYRETFQTAGRAAAAGGFTRVAVFPNTEPVVDSKPEVLYVVNANTGHPVEFLPIGALTKACEGRDITEMLDMRDGGAVAFSDGLHAIQHSGVMLRALLYGVGANTLIIQPPFDEAIAPHGHMHEGEISTVLGLPGFPALSETLMIERDLALLDYTGSRLHFHGVSCARSVALIRAAKASGAAVSCSTPALNLLFSDLDLESFDSSLKVMPPLRRPDDREALVEGVLDGTIDLVCSNHLPVEEEKKKLEFAYAEFGAIGLETVFPLLMEVLGERIDASWIAQRLSTTPHHLLGIPVPVIEPGQAANLTLFSMDQSRTWTYASYLSLSRNAPIHDRKLPGLVLGVINRSHFWHLSEE